MIGEAIDAGGDLPAFILRDVYAWLIVPRWSGVEI